MDYLNFPRTCRPFTGKKSHHRYSN